MDVVSWLLEHFYAEPERKTKSAGRMDSFPERPEQHMEQTCSDKIMQTIALLSSHMKTLENEALLSQRR